MEVQIAELIALPKPIYEHVIEELTLVSCSAIVLNIN